jgi:hypothetical protein
LCPTTLLCEQHFQTFTDRFAQVGKHWPVKIVELSRFRTTKETKAAMKVCWLSTFIRSTTISGSRSFVTPWFKAKSR